MNIRLSRPVRKETKLYKEHIEQAENFKRIENNGMKPYTIYNPSTQHIIQKSLNSWMFLFPVTPSPLMAIN